MIHVKDILSSDNEFNWKILFYLVLDQIDTDRLVDNTLGYYVDRTEYTLSPFVKELKDCEPVIKSNVEIVIYHATTRQISTQNYDFQLAWSYNQNKLEVIFTWDDHFRWHTISNEELMCNFEKKKLLMS